MIVYADFGLLWRPLPYTSLDRLISVSSGPQIELGLGVFDLGTLTYAPLRPRVTTFDPLGLRPDPRAPHRTGGPVS